MRRPRTSPEPALASPPVKQLTARRGPGVVPGAEAPTVSGRGLVRPVAWAWWAGTAAFTLLNVVLLAANYSTPLSGGTATGRLEFVAGVGYLAIATIGLAGVLRSPRNGSGWAFLAAGGAVALGALLSEYAIYGLVTEPGSLPGGRWAAWLGAWTWWAGAAFGLAFALLLYPDGALPSSRWRWAARVAALDVVLLALLHALTPGDLDGEYAIARNPLGFDVGGSMVRSVRDLSWLFLAANAAIGTTAVLRRVRTSPEPERRPLYWVAGAGAATAVTVVLWGVYRGDEDASSSVQLVVALAILAIPAAGALVWVQTASLRRSIERPSTTAWARRWPALPSSWTWRGPSSQPTPRPPRPSSTA